MIIPGYMWENRPVQGPKQGYCGKESDATEFNITFSHNLNNVYYIACGETNSLFSIPKLVTNLLSQLAGKPIVYLVYRNRSQTF